MKLVNKSKNIYILRFDSGEDLLDLLRGFCDKESIKSGWFQIIGSTRSVELAYYNLKTKEYESRPFDEDLEIVSASGNIALKEGGVFCHAHGVFGRSDMSTIGGHINKCEVSATAEVVLFAGEGEMNREFDEKTGLHLFK